MKKLLIGAAFAAASVTSTSAFAEPANWSGPYVGVNAGYVLGSTTIDDYDCDLACSSINLSPHGAAVGGTVGFNHQTGALVLGIEGDWDYASAKKSLVFPWGYETNSYHNTKINSFGTIRARAGVAVDKALLFGTAGVGFIAQHTSAYSPYAADDEETGNRDAFNYHSTRAGIALGAGVEYKLSEKLSAKFEYLTIRTPTKTSIPDSSGNCSEEYDTCDYGAKNELDTVRVGVNYAF